MHVHHPGKGTLQVSDLSISEDIGDISDDLARRDKAPKTNRRFANPN
jgi:hypothetical protein